jgi:Family of unknown function (DUF5331)
METMAFFGSLKNSLKQKWLQYFQSNRFWISLHSGVATPDGGKRPPSYLILGVINALEPQLAELMLPFSKLNPNVDTLIEVLGLNFDPDLMLGNTHQATNEVQERRIQVDDFLEINLNDEFVVVVDEAESLGGGSSVPKDFQEAESLRDGSSVPKAFQEQAAFTVTSLNEIDLDETEEETSDHPVANSLDDFGDVFLGVGDEVMGELEFTPNSDFTNNEQQVQDTQDISGLFPNY